METQRLEIDRLTAEQDKKLQAKQESQNFMVELEVVDLLGRVFLKEGPDHFDLDKIKRLYSIHDNRQEELLNLSSIQDLDKIKNRSAEN